MDLVLILGIVFAIGVVLVSVIVLLMTVILRLNDVHLDFNLNDDEDLP